MEEEALVEVTETQVQEVLTADDWDGGEEFVTVEEGEEDFSWFEDESAEEYYHSFQEY